MERLAPNSLTGALDDSYLGNLTSVSDGVYECAKKSNANLTTGGQSYHRCRSSCRAGPAQLWKIVSNGFRIYCGT